MNKFVVRKLNLLKTYTLGIIRQQTIKGSVYSYLGAILGMVNTAILYPRILQQEEIGLLNWLLAVSAIASQFSTLGFNNVTTRLFPYFRNEKQGHHGFLFLVSLVGLAGFVLSVIAFLILKPYAVDLYEVDSPIYLKFLILLVPLVFFSLFFFLLEAYNRVMYDAVSGIFMRDILFKVIVLGLLVLMATKVLSFTAFVYLYVVAYCLPTVLLFLLLCKRGQVSMKPEWNFIRRDLRRSMVSVSFFGILNGLSDKLTANIDRIMIVSMTTLADNGIYATMANFGVLVSMPSRPLKKIASTVIAEAFKRKDMATVRQVYSQSGLHQFIVACLLFIGIWVNIDNIFHIVPSDYLPGKWVVFYIGMAHVLNMVAGISGVVIQSSPYYRMQTWLMIIFGVAVIVTNYLMIPVWGITGAAAATLLSAFLFNFLKFFFLARKYHLQPFNGKYLLVICIAVGAYFAGCILPEMPHFILDIVIRSILVSVVYVSLTLLFSVSEELNEQARKFWEKRIKPFIS